MKNEDDGKWKKKEKNSTRHWVRRELIRATYKWPEKRKRWNRMESVWESENMKKRRRKKINTFHEGVYNMDDQKWHLSVMDQLSSSSSSPVWLLLLLRQALMRKFTLEFHRYDCFALTRSVSRRHICGHFSFNLLSIFVWRAERLDKTLYHFDVCFCGVKYISATWRWTIICVHSFVSYDRTIV